MEIPVLMSTGKENLIIQVHKFTRIFIVIAERRW